MKIKILTPEMVVFDGEVDSILVPGINGEFHIFNHHAAIVSALKTGHVKLYGAAISEKNAPLFQQDTDGKSYAYPINSGVIEFNNDKAILLCE